MANVRIKDITTTASAPAADDYLAIDGATSGTRKILAKDLQTETDTTLSVSGQAADAKATGDSLTELKEDLENINDIIYAEAYLPTPENAWIRYSNGEKVTSSATDLYVFTNYLPKAIKAFLTSDTNVLCAIAFYRTDTISTSGYMASASVDFENGVHNDGLWYEAIVPDNCKCIAITTKKPSTTVAEPKILFDEFYNITQEFSTDMFSGDVSDLLTRTWPFYIRYSDGVPVPSGNYFGYYAVTNEGFTKVKAHLYSGDTVPAAISFYSSDTIGTDSYMKSDSIQCITGWGDYETNVPEGCKTIVFCTRNDGANGSVSIQFNTKDISASGYFKAVQAKEQAEKTEAKQQSYNSYTFPFAHNRYYGHMLMDQVTNSFSSNIIIPSQSVFDVQTTKRIGFNYMEGNVHKTSDGKYVVTHGISGKLGNDFETLDGNPANDVVIANTTFNDLRNNYRYRSIYDKYKVPITSLEEFCQALSAHGMFPVLQYIDQTELAIVKQYFGNNIILYNGSRSVFDGFIMEYLNYSTKEEIIARCQSVGAPYMYCMANSSAFTDAELSEIISAVHDLGCYIGNAGNYNDMALNLRIQRLGFDFSASGYMPNDFEIGNLANVFDNGTFADIDHTGTVANGVLTLAEGQRIKISQHGKSNAYKLIVDMLYEGELVIVNSYVSSDGTIPVHWGYCCVNDGFDLYLESVNGSTVVKNISYKISEV